MRDNWEEKNLFTLNYAHFLKQKLNILECDKEMNTKKETDKNILIFSRKMINFHHIYRETMITKKKEKKMASIRLCITSSLINDFSNSHTEIDTFFFYRSKWLQVF